MIVKESIYPVIKNQHATYVYKQLIDFRSGARANSSDGVMNMMTKLLTDTEIEALSTYIYSL